MDAPGLRRICKDSLGFVMIPWVSRGFAGSRCESEDALGFARIHWDSLGVAGISALGFAVIRKDSLGFARIPWDSQGFAVIRCDS